MLNVHVNIICMTTFDKLHSVRHSELSDHCLFTLTADFV